MDPATYQSQFRIFDRARALRGTQRLAYLDEVCGRDTGLRVAVEELLEQYDSDSNPINDERARAGREQLAEILASGEAPGPLPASIGPYRILRKIGAGGMGVVFEAEQPRPHRRVALKVLHPSLAHGERLRRFRHEAELLARLHHPGIAQVLAAETVDQGHGEQPWFAMELVEGRPLVDDAQRRDLDRRARIELVAKICDAVQHAHDRGIIHRDLKPDNILVEPDGRPKVLDFGVARSSEPSAQLSTLHTGQGEILGTVTHMAPEQLRGERAVVGPAADVWALGVILFELLTERLPYELAGRSLPAAIQLLGEKRPRRLIDIDRSLRGDLDTIVAKALESEPHRRYPSPAALAADLRRWIAHEPIEARRPSRIYRARRFARRQPAVMALMSTAAVASVAILWFAVLENRSRRSAEEDQKRAEEMGVRLQASLFSANQATWGEDPYGAGLLLEGVAESERGWAWNWLASRSPLRIARSNRWNVPAEEPPQFLNDRSLVYYEFENKKAKADFVTIDLTEPHLRIQRTEGLKFPGVRGVLFGDTLVGYRREKEGDQLGYLGFVIDTRTWSVREAARFSDGEIPVIACAPDGSVLGYTRIEDEDDVHLHLARPTSEGPPRYVVAKIPYSAGYRWSPDGSRIAFAELGEAEPAVMILDAQNLDPLLSFKGRKAGIRVGWSPDGSKLAIAERGHSLTVLRMPDFQEDLRIELNDEYILEVGWNSSGNHLGLLSSSGFRSFDPLTGALQRTVPMHLSENEVRDARSRVPFDLSPDGRLLSTYVDGNYQPWIIDLDAPAASGQTVVPLEHWAYRVAVSPDGDLVATVCPTEREVILHDAWSGEVLASLPLEDSWLAFDMMSWLSFDRIGDSVALVTHRPDADAHVLAFDLLDGSSSKGPGRNSHGIWKLPSLLLQDFQRATDLIAPDLNHAIAIHPSTGDIWLGDPVSPQMLAPETVQASSISSRGNFRPFELATGEWLTRLGIHGLDLSPDQNSLVISSSRSIFVCDPDSGEVLHTSPVPDSAKNYAVRYSPDGRLLALGSRAGSITLFDTERWVQVLSIDAHDDYVYDLAWSPDGTRLFSVGGDATLRIWDSIHPIARGFQAEDRERLFAQARERLSELNSRLGDAAAAGRALMQESEGQLELRIAARRACVEALGP